MTRLGFVGVLLLAAAGLAVPADSEVIAGDGTAGFEDGQAAKFNKPIRLAPYGEDAVVVADIFNHAIRVVTLAGEVTTLAGDPECKGHQDGPVATARFASPHGVAVSPIGVIAVAEAENHTIRLLTPEGARGFQVSTVAGVPGEKGMRDGPASQALFHSPHAVVWTDDGALLVADIGNRRIRLVQDGRVSTVAGSGEEGAGDGPALTASFTYPMDIALAPDGSLMIADAGTHLIRRLATDGQVTTLSLQGELHTPHGISVAPDGMIYIADMRAHQVVSVDARGALDQICGSGTSGSGPEELNRPAAVLVHSGKIWIADLDNHRISVVSLQ